jgi:hypothetical protein
MSEKTYLSVQWSVKPGMNKIRDYISASANSYLLNSFCEVCMHHGLCHPGISGKLDTNCSKYLEFIAYKDSR